ENHSKVKKAEKNFREANVEDIIEIKEGHALNILKEILYKYKKSDKRPANQLDFVFVDADKENLIEYFDLVLPMVRVGGIIAVDNMLYPEQFRPIMKKYADYVRSRSNVQSVMLPIGNGEEITIKTG
ncbi:MAG: O-methyltransferase, partial [Nitrosopumilaceae archaeon]